MLQGDGGMMRQNWVVSLETGSIKKLFKLKSFFLCLSTPRFS